MVTVEAFAGMIVGGVFKYLVTYFEPAASLKEPGI